MLNQWARIGRKLCLPARGRHHPHFAGDNHLAGITIGTATIPARAPFHPGECGPHQDLAALAVWRLFHSAARWHQADAEPRLSGKRAEAAGDSIAVAVPAYTGCGKSRLYLALKGRTFRACPEPAEGCAVVILLFLSFRGASAPRNLRFLFIATTFSAACYSRV